ncbi:hypothetical protein L1887_17389 [Cichorium endivia]|nr:hypothetical protein L1887_17389 [Cichorium endivia]
MAESSKSITDSDTRGPTTVVASCNFPATSDPMKYKEPLRVVIHVLNRHLLSSTLFCPPLSVLMSLLVATIDSAIKHNECLTVTLANGVEVTLDKKVFTEALKLLYHPSATTAFYSPFNNACIKIFYFMGYEYDMSSLYSFKKTFLRRLFKGFLKYGDHEDELVKQHMVITENVEDYLKALLAKFGYACLDMSNSVIHWFCAISISVHKS